MSKAARGLSGFIVIGGYMCATSWCDLDLTFDLAYLMLFIYLWGYVILFYLSYISLISFYLNLGCCNLGVS